MSVSSQADKPRILVVSQLPPPYGGLANNMSLYRDSSLFDDYDPIFLNLSSGSQREKDPERPTIPTAFFAASIIPKLIHLIVTKNPQLVYMKAGTKWGFWRDMCVILVTKLFRRKLVCHLHSPSSGTLITDHRCLHPLFRGVMRLPDRVIVLTEKLRREFSDLINADKLVVINNIVNASIFRHASDAEAPCRSEASDETIRVLFVGRLSRDKGVWDLFEVIPDIAAGHRDVRFQLAGAAFTERDEQIVRARCSKAPLKDHVELLGIIRGDQKVQTFLSADVFVLPSYMDNMPNVILEAFAAGLPVVAYGIAQVPEMVDEAVNGFVVEPGHTHELAERLTRLIESRELRRRMGEASRRQAGRVYDIEIGAAKMREVFSQLLSSGS